MSAVVIGICALFVLLILVFVRSMGSGGSSSKSAGGSTALKEKEYQKFKMIEKRPITHNTVIFRFATPKPNQRVGLPVGKHMLLRFFDAEKKPISRAYTPISSDSELGYFDLLIKLYPQGKMSQHLQQLNVGQDIDIRGPQGSLEYKGNGNFMINRKVGSEVVPTPCSISHVGMIAGGSGITPMLQIIRDVSAHPADTTKCSLIFANVSEEDILLRSELEEQKEKRDATKVYYTLDKPPAGWSGETGFVTSDMIKKYLPAPSSSTLILLCGPKPMVDIMEKHLTALGYTEDMIFKY